MKICVVLACGDRSTGPPIDPCVAEGDNLHQQYTPELVSDDENRRGTASSGLGSGGAPWMMGSKPEEGWLCDDAGSARPLHQAPVFRDIIHGDTADFRGIIS